MIKKIIFISGASRGIGLSIANYFAEIGHTVIGTSRSDFQFEKKLPNLISYKLDINCRESIHSCIKYLKKEDMLPNILVNNAGITSDQIFLRMKDEQWDDVLATNLTGTFNLTKAFTKNMVKNKFGRIINISSVAGLMGNAGQVNYASAKAGLGGFTKSLAKELGSRGITVNSIAPGFIETDMTSFLNNDAKNNIMKTIPLKRFGIVDDITNAVSFLASDEAQYITGQTISIDGGLFMH